MNDIFMIYADESINQIDFLQVFDRWGGLVFERRDFAPNDVLMGWDGTMRGQMLNAGVYVYQAQITKLDEVLILSGDVSLIR